MVVVVKEHAVCVKPKPATLSAAAAATCTGVEVDVFERRSLLTRTWSDSNDLSECWFGIGLGSFLLPGRIDMTVN